NQENPTWGLRFRRFRGSASSDSGTSLSGRHDLPLRGFFLVGLLTLGVTGPQINRRGHLADLLHRYSAGERGGSVNRVYNLPTNLRGYLLKLTLAVRSRVHQLHGVGIMWEMCKQGVNIAPGNTSPNHT